MSEDHSTASRGGPHTDVLGASRVIAGKYRLGRLLGEGGMSTVYEAEHTGIGHKVAIKFLSETVVGDPTSLARFQREARAMGQIKHENVVGVMDNGTDEKGVPYLVMEMLEGESLHALLQRETSLSFGLAAWIGQQTLAGLCAAHAKGVIHRDLKPANVFIARQSDGSFRVKLLDFGISKLGGAGPTLDVTAAGALVGTPTYMAPEQIRAEPHIDVRVDVYSAGVMLYRMVAGQLPYVATTAKELYRLVLEGKPKPPRAHRPEIAPELEAVIMKAMHLDPGMRFPDASSFLSALRVAVPSEPIDAIAARASARPPPTQDVGGTDPMALAESATAETIAASPSARSQPAQSHARPAPAPARRWPLLVGVLAVLAAIGATLAVWATRRNTHATKHGNGAATVESIAQPVRFGIIRHEEPRTIQEEMRPFLDYLEQRLNKPVQLVIVQNYADLADNLLDKEVDIAALSGMVYVDAKRRHPGIQLLATPVTETGPTYEGYILVRADSDIRELTDLEGKIFCYVSPTSTSGYLYPRALLRKAGLDPDAAFKATRFTSDHPAALRALADGACDAAAVYASIWHDAGKYGMDPASFTVVAKTERIPWDAYTVAPDMDPKMVEQLRAALEALRPGSAEARKALAKMPIAGFQGGEDHLYDSVREIEQYLDGNDTATE